MKWTELLLAALCLITPPQQDKESKEPTKIIIVDEAGKRTEDRVLGLYEDAECTKPYKDKDGKPLQVKADPEGNYGISVPQEICYVKSEPVTGYYPVIAAVHKGEGGSLVQYAVNAVIETVLPQGEEGPVILQLLDGEEHVITEWKSNEEFPDSRKLNADTEYSIRMKEPKPYRVIADGKLQVPKTRPEELRKEVRIEVYGEVQFVSEEETGAEYTLYTDKECQKKALDIHGAEITFKAGEEVTAQLFPQTFYVQQTAVNDAYYLRKEPSLVSVAKEETSAYTLNEEQVHMTITADTDCSVHIQRAGDAEEVLKMTAGSEMEVSGRRNETITLHTDPVPGYFDAEDITGTFAEYAQDEQDISLILHPFSVTAAVRDRKSGSYVSGGKIVILDAGGNVVFSQISREIPLAAAGLEAGNTYTVKLEGTAGHYYPLAEKEIRIPERYSEESGDTFEAVIECAPFTAVTLKEGSGQLYTDEACTDNAMDIYGGPAVLSQEDALLSEGIYWLKTEAREGYYAQEYPLKVEVCGEAELTVDAEAEPVRLAVTVVNERESTVKGAVIQLLDETKENILAQKILEEDNVVFGEDVLRTEETYYVRQIAAADHYLKDLQDYEVNIPKRREADLQVHLHNGHYSTLLLHVYPDGQIPDEQWDVYTEDGQPAEDIYHHTAQLTFENTEEAAVQLKDGTYVLKQTRNTPGIYPDGEAIVVELGEEDMYEISRQNTASVLFVRIKEDDGEVPAGLVMEARGEDGTVYDSWNAETCEHRIDGLSAGNTVILQAVKLPDGYETQQAEYRCTMPSSVPETVPVTEILLVRKPVRSLLPKHIADKDVPPTLPWGIVTGAGSLVLMGIRFVLRKAQRM